MDRLVLSRAAVRALDRKALEEHGLPGVVLMENAGRACADEALRMVGEAPGAVLVLCGPGNNGGDGFVIARTLRNRGREARVVFVGPRAKLEAAADDASAHLGFWRALGGGVEFVEGTADLPLLEARLATAALVVDALFGTGLARPLGEPWSAAVRAVNAAGRPVLAVDLPSGLDADSGAELGVAVRADATVTFVAWKPGLLAAQGPRLAGRVVVAEIGVPGPLSACPG